MLERAELEDTVTERRPLTAHVGESGAGLERWVLDDGGTLVVKRLAPDLDFLMALTHDTSGRELTLWQSGLLDHLTEGVEHAIVGGWRGGWRGGSGRSRRRALRLALLAGLVWLGGNKALDAHEHPDAEIREREREDLDWWVGQARSTQRSGLL